jgi:glucokinase
MHYCLAVDIGGTKTLFRLLSVEGVVVVQQRLDSQAFATFDDCFDAFLTQSDCRDKSIQSACLAVAGPVQGRLGQVTKLPWRLDADVLETVFDIEHVQLCNDFEAVGYGVAVIESESLMTLHAGSPSTQPMNKAVIGAGTGLGQAFLIPLETHWRVLPTEGGHVDFAPVNELQMGLLAYLQTKFEHVSYDRIVCGSGIKLMFDYLATRDEFNISESLATTLSASDDAAAVISDFAQHRHDALCMATFQLFFDIYAAQVGNLALASFARQGVYLAGGIAAKNMALLDVDRFVSQAQAKGRMHDLLADFPIYIVLDDEVGVNGAAYLARKALYN